ncbi:hypothetical protein QP531_06680 [Peptoniphilus harei]|uniref:hypothetical protein n=1 Tax=Peptoniphilus harei TaxID=54005 RepID=UPI00254F24A4|nr:hypothetical protein [Peptoniphilus harei]MDK7377502.1 hypothetical protein [Peptoniphilus harei]MDK7679814.1 hypothetical protein [Peptoniphilus harei]
MQLNELKRINNILYLFTGLGKKEVTDETKDYKSCHYLFQYLNMVRDFVEENPNYTKPPLLCIHYLEEDKFDDIDEDTSDEVHCKGLDILNSIYYEIDNDDCYIHLGIRAKSTLYKKDRAYFYPEMIFLDIIKAYIEGVENYKPFEDYDYTLSDFEIAVDTIY